MASWREFETEAPDLARRVRAAFDVHKHKTIATLRADGAPRISGTEADFDGDELWFGSMWQARKARDLQRDPRFALHSATVDEHLTLGDAKLSGRALEVDPQTREAWSSVQPQVPPEPFHLFRADITEVVLTSIGDPADHIVVELWKPGAPVRRTERR